jgi:hypothetical protein
MKAFKLKEDYGGYGGFIYKQGRLLVKMSSEPIMLATPTQGTLFCGNYLFNTLQNKGLLEEVDLQNERWVHPHLHKSVRIEFEKEKVA